MLNSDIEVTIDITHEIRQAIERYGEEPLRLENPLNRETYVLLKAATFERIERMLARLIGKQDEWQAADAYVSADEAFREGWEAPGMYDYDEYDLKATLGSRLRRFRNLTHPGS